MVLEFVADFLGERFLDGANVLQHPFGLGAVRLTKQRGQGEAEVRLAGAVACDGESKWIFPGNALSEGPEHITSKRRGIGQSTGAGNALHGLLCSRPGTDGGWRSRIARY